MANQTRPQSRRKLWPTLSFKLAVAFAFVSILGILLVALFIRMRAQGEFDHYVRVRVDSDFGSRLADYYVSHQGWEGVGAIFTTPQLAPQRPSRVQFTVVDSGHNVVYGNGQYTTGTLLQDTALDQAMPIETDGKVVGWLLVDPLSTSLRDAPTPEGDYLNRITNAVIIAALVAMLVAVVLGASLARTLSHPIQELTEATRKVAKGALGYQVQVRTRDELGALAESFNQMSADLAQATNQRLQMTADIAHELRSPLSVILGYTEALSEGKLPGSDEVFQSLHIEARHLQRLIDDLRTLSLADAGELPLALRAVSPRLLLEQVRAAHTARARQQRVSLRVQAAADLPDLEVDPDRIAQVLGNLVSNALRYTPSKGEVVLSAEPHGDQIEVRIQDTGAGIPAKDLPHIFDRFYRGDEARHTSEGESGLGLAIAKSIVEAHRGTITAESSQGQGATFILRLPAHGSQAE
jgi:signal transduction histidine kinase